MPNAGTEVLTAEDFTNHDDKFRYMLLSRLQMDCEYYLGYGNRCPKHLWSLNEEKHILDMKALHNTFGEGEKPEWLTWEDILEFEEKMLDLTPAT